MYIISILICIALVCIVNIAINSSLYNLEIWQIFVAVIISVAAVMIIDGLFAFVVRRCLPEKWFSPKTKLKNISKFETKFYKFIKVKKWKDKVLELGTFTNFSKRKIAETNNLQYTTRFLTECNYGVWCHITGMIFGFLIIFIFPLKYAPLFGLPVAIINAFYNYLSVAILRYNTPKLNALYKRNLKYQQVEKQGEQI